MTTKVLNPGLFRYMRRKFGSVKVANQGIPLTWQFEESQTTGLGFDFAVSPGHEHYVTFCPVCDYHKPTLWVSYMFLQKVNLGNRDHPMWHHIMNLSCCYHCHCEDDRRGIVPRQVWNLGRSTDERPSSELLHLFEKYFDDVLRGRAVSIETLPPAADGPLVEKIPLPPGSVPLSELSDDHAAVEYLLRGRKTPVDPGYISDVYDVRFCGTYTTVDHGEDVKALTYQRAYNRLIFPFYKDGELVTWQMRICHPMDNRPRWLFPPGQGQHFYGWDIAKHYRGLILVEGCCDVYAAGPASMAICTSNLSLRRCKELTEQWDYFVIALDPKEFEHEIKEDNGRTRVGHAYVVQERLTEAGATYPPVLFSYGGLQEDPSDLGPQRFDQILRELLPTEYYNAVRIPRSEVP